MGLFLNESKDPSIVNLNEAFLGKSKGLKEAEAIIQEAFNEGGQMKFMETMIARPDIQSRFERKLEEIFNFSRVFFDVDVASMQHSDNAFTLSAFPNPLGLYDEKYSYAVERKDTYRYKTPNGKFCYLCITPSMLTYLNAEEFMGIMLHEIGHNFYKFNIAGTLYHVLLTPTILVWKTIFSGVSVVKRIASETTFGKIIFVIAGYYSFIMNVISKLLKPLGTFLPFAFPMFILQRLVHLPVDFLKLVFGEGYNNEVFSDNFATIHGYGPALSSALTKMKKENVDSQGFLGTADSEFVITKVARFAETVLMTVLAAADPHPEINNRIKDQKNFLRKELDAAKTPKAREMLKKEHEIMVKMYDDAEETGKRLHYINKDFLDVFRESVSLMGNKTEVLDKEQKGFFAKMFPSVF
jgi:Zn-dependent protease with chaperone function